MDIELLGLNNALTWTLVPTHEANNIITGKWGFKLKYKNGKIERYKARWCARDFSEVKGVDFT